MARFNEGDLLLSSLEKVIQGGEIVIDQNFVGRFSSIIWDNLLKNQTASGEISTVQVDFNLSGFGAGLYVNTDGSFYEYYDSERIVSVLALESGTGLKKVLFRGFIRNDTWNWTPGQLIYSSDSGGMTQVKPPSNKGKVLGIATTTNIMYFNPRYCNIIESHEYNGTSGTSGTSGSNKINKEKAYTYNQSLPSTIWNVIHNLGYRYVNVEFIDSNNEMIIPDTVVFLDSTSLVATFAEAVSGRASVTYGARGSSGTSGSSGSSGTSGSSSTSGTSGSGPGQDYGYCIGGNIPEDYVSTIDRITFPFDSGIASYVGNLSQKVVRSGGCNSTNYGYSTGGYHSNRISTIDRITFPFNSGTANHVGNLSQKQDTPSNCNSTNYGYSMGGYSNDYVTTIDRITFPFNSGTANHVGNLTHYKYGGGSCNSSNYGYYMAGEYALTALSTIDRITFPFNSGTANHVGNLSRENAPSAGCNSSNYGYNMGGSFAASYSTIIDRITFPFNSGIASTVGNLSSSATNTAGCNSSNYGYRMGGYTYFESTHTYFSTVDRITFPFDSGIASHTGNLSKSRYSCAGIDGTDFVTLF